MWPFRARAEPAPEPVPPPSGWFSTEGRRGDHPLSRQALIETITARALKPLTPVVTAAMDSALAADSLQDIKAAFSAGLATVPEAQLLWYASFGFIGHQTCALLAQHWLIDKICTMPARDAVRCGYEITVNDGTPVSPQILDALRKADKTANINKQMVEFVRFGRVFGIRICMPRMELPDLDQYHLCPYNPDGVTPGSYKGLVQIDPTWCAPLLDGPSAANPASPHFDEPTWWMINGRRVHRSHLIIFKAGEVADILRPSYLFGGIPVPQRIAERVYAAERTANEGPLLALSKRTTVLHTDVERALADQAAFEDRLAGWVHYRDNHGVKILGEAETLEQLDTSLAGLDETIMTQFQLVAAAGNIPATKLLGTSPKGFGASGDYEAASYREELESVQEHDLTPLLERHHQLVIRSEIAPRFGIAPFETTVAWKPLDALTAKERADINKVKAETDAILAREGAIDGAAIRARIIADPDSGHNGLAPEAAGTARSGSK